MRTTSKLAGLLDLTEVGELRWTTASDNLGLPQLFGGQLVGQTLVAAGRALGDDKTIHSSYTSFLRAGRHDEPLTLAAEVVRAGRQQATIRVEVLQGDRLLCVSTVTGGVVDDGIAHQRPAPQTRAPHDSPPFAEMAEADGGLSAMWDGMDSVEVRVGDVDPAAHAAHSAAPPVHVWMRATDELPDDRLFHIAAAGYQSDLMLMSTAVTPQGLAVGMENTFARDWWAVSLDHAMWFQGDFRADDWLMWEHVTPMAHASRALVQATAFTADGAAVCHVTQQALLRRQA
ncbi:acyl-CoA thioesterase [Pimelobacter simplex]|uniref:acyl-CoA thioesterase n=1 Tax=Nocardioides simplex TaxID=2045 RepID=UPI00366B7231